MQSMLKLLCVTLLVLSQAVFALPDGAVNVNTAAPEALATALDGVGASKAQAIVDYREQFGEFSGMEDLLDVRGIGPQVIEANRNKIVFAD